MTRDGRRLIECPTLRFVHRQPKLHERITMGIIFAVLAIAALVHFVRWLFG